MMISNKMTFLKKNEKRMKNPSGSFGNKLHRPIHEREQEATDAGLYLVDEFVFPHAVYNLVPSDLNVEGLQYGYKKLFNFLNLKETPE